MELCPCSSKLSFAQCCEPFIEGKKRPPTAESLMRARYSAYAKGKIDFIERTQSSGDFDREAAKQWSQKAAWQGLEVLKVDGGGAEDKKGVVEFKAKYRMDEQDFNHHEKSSFAKKDGEWFLLDGKMVQETVRREGPKIGRNDPCPCGSGKKFKKCCEGKSAGASA